MAFGLGDFLLSGSHGLEHARPGQSAEAMDRPLAIDFVLEKLRSFASVSPAILVAETTMGAGLPFRPAPQYEAADLAFRLHPAGDTAPTPQGGTIMSGFPTGHAGEGQAKN